MLDTMYSLSLFPEINPYKTGLLQVSSLHQIYYEECGNPLGVPVVFLHGGPGSGCNPKQRRFFDPQYYRIILLDQRGCGRSLPLGCIEDNTIAHLVADIDTLRQHLHIERWLIFGGSWGSTLGISYALAHTNHVTGLILRGIFLSRPKELAWFLGDVQFFFPDAWEKLINYLPKNVQKNPLETYSELIFSTDESISIPAAIQWNAFESSIMSLLPSQVSATVNGNVELARARVQIHYILNRCFVGQRDLLQEASLKLSNIPTTIIQGRYDMVCPPITAWNLSHAMPHATFITVSDAGHSAMEKGVTHALINATEQFKSNH